MILRARILLPVSRPPIENGAVRVRAGRIRQVGPWPELTADAGEGFCDLGEVILLPGLVNAHCHLDYTDMAGQLPPQRTFADWLKAMVALKAQWSRDDFARSWQHGAAMLLRTGTTTVADVEAIPECIPELWAKTPLRVLSFRELLGLRRSPPAEDLVRQALTDWSALPADRVGLSPHAPYTTTPELLRVAAQEARTRGWRLTTHVAESQEEFDMFSRGGGPLHDWLKGQRDMADCGRSSPVRHLERCDYLGPDLLAVHVNYLGPGDAALLGRHGVSVAHCPRSHAYFRHASFPRAELERAGVNLCLGTDSLATVLKAGRQPLELSLRAELWTLAQNDSGLSPAAILQMATANAARALGLQGDIGELSEGARADLIVLPFAGGLAQAGEAVVHHAGEMKAVMIAGRWEIGPEV
jgi:cytosine/adenosine deaminase-related metal-dependent hydrolase